MLENSHFLIHPARAEAYGCVVPEACSFALPCLVSHVGGLSTSVKDGRNGYVFPIGSAPQVYAQCIREIFSDMDRYVHLARSTFEEYKQRLNWKVAVRDAIQEIEKTLGHLEKLILAQKPMAETLETSFLILNSRTCFSISLN